MLSFIKNYPTISYTKGAVIVPQNTICKYLFYLKKGTTRTFQINEMGEDNTIWFAFQNTPVTLFASFTQQIPSLYGLEALEDCELYRISKFELENILKENPEIHTSFYASFSSQIQKMTQRMLDLQMISAKERYLKLLKQEPLIFQKANLGYIASYLGITQQSLSRIRANM